jgi:alkanesulfonate monooxygenase SsuD/methylene tetrahydromethanopterin reductase-like flavin-dependent oxidoreductase (luciferase family)
VKFGLFYEISVPRPWTGANEKAVYDNCLEQVRLGDELGFDQVWAVEHHFLGDQSHCSAPELFLTACAMVTTKMRIGHGIVICVPEFSHPVRIAERCAVMDIVSGGRLEVGTGRSATWTELGGFNADPDTTKKSWDEYVRVLPKMWTQDSFSWDGVFFSMPPRNVLPKPVQKPHPPLWVAVTSPGTELDAAERGLGCVGVSFGTFEDNEKKVAEYRRRIRLCEPAGDFVNEQVNMLSFLYCHEDSEQGITTGQRLSRGYNYAAAQFYSAKEAYPSRFYASAALLPQLRQETVSAAEPTRVPESLCIGDPHRVTEVLKKWEATGVDRVTFLMDRPEIIPQEQVLESMRLFAREVMPHFQD